MIEENAVVIAGLSIQLRIVTACVIVAAAFLVDLLCCRFVAPVIRKIARRTPIKWDDYLTRGKVLNYIFHLIPPITFYVIYPLFLDRWTVWHTVAEKGLSIYIILIFCKLVCEFISNMYAMTAESDALRNKPMKGVYQLLKVIVVGIVVILIIGILINKDFTVLLTGLGAMATVLMLVFKDTILGVVAGIQLSAHDMLRPGDWIVMEKYNANGTVEDVTMNTVKVRNWDNTITTIPPYALVSDSFINWRGMRESDGRRVSRAIRIDMNSIRFCSEEEIAKFKDESWAKGLKLSTETVNLTLYRAAAEHYLRSLPEVNKELFLVVRQLEPTAEGLPLQIYFFTLDKNWVPHEHIAAQVLEYLIAALPEFGLRAYQRTANFPPAETVK